MTELATIAAWFEERWRGAGYQDDPTPIIREAKRLWPDVSQDIHMQAAATAALVIELEAEEMIAEARRTNDDNLRRGLA